MSSGPFPNASDESVGKADDRKSRTKKRPGTTEQKCGFLTCNSNFGVIFAKNIRNKIMERQPAMTREEALLRLRKSKEIKAKAVERLKKELGDIVEKNTGVRPTQYFVL